MKKIQETQIIQELEAPNFIKKRFPIQNALLKLDRSLLSFETASKIRGFFN